MNKDIHLTVLPLEPNTDINFSDNENTNEEDDDNIVTDRNHIFPLRARYQLNRKIWFDKTWIYAIICIIFVLVFIILFGIKLFIFS